jgi:hypothetical protein
MPDCEDKDDIEAGFSRDVSVCVLTLDRIIGELATRYGAASVAAALIEVVGCSSCAVDHVSRGTSIRALMERIGVSR